MIRGDFAIAFAVISVKGQWPARGLDDVRLSVRLTEGANNPEKGQLSVATPLGKRRSVLSRATKWIFGFTTAGTARR